ncbi:MAG: hypothetical protein IPM48_08950 [Saprospiraceae bacterium]|nr:hypothetical protein [Saprospiraceae bacterium]
MRHLYLILFFWAQYLNAQVDDSEFKRIVEFDEFHFVNYSIPEDVAVESLDNMDLAEAIPYTSKIHVKIMVNQYNQLSVERIYFPGPTSISRYPGIGRSIYDGSSLRLFDKNGKELNENTDPAKVSSEITTLSDEQIQMLGFEHEIKSPTLEQIELLAQEGVQAFQAEDRKFYMINGEVNLISDETNGYVEYRLFNGSILGSAEIKYYHNLGSGKAILRKKIHKSYLPITTGALMEVQDIVLYSNYRVVDQGTEIYRQFSSDELELNNLTSRSSGISTYIKVQPLDRMLEVIAIENAVFKINLPTLKGLNASLVLVSLDGRILRHLQLTDDRLMQLDLSDLLPGNYLLHYSDSMGRITNQIINF